MVENDVIEAAGNETAWGQKVSGKGGGGHGFQGGTGKANRWKRNESGERSIEVGVRLGAGVKESGSEDDDRSESEDCVNQHPSAAQLVFRRTGISGVGDKSRRAVARSEVASESKIVGDANVSKREGETEEASNDDESKDDNVIERESKDDDRNKSKDQSDNEIEGESVSVSEGEIESESGNEGEKKASDEESDEEDKEASAEEKSEQAAIEVAAKAEQAKNEDTVNAVLQQIIKSGQYSLGYNTTLKTLRQGKAEMIFIANNCPAVRKKVVECSANVAKTRFYHFHGDNIEFGKACGRKYRVSFLSLHRKGKGKGKGKDG